MGPHVQDAHATPFSTSHSPEGVVSIWLGTAAKKKLFDDYFKETYGDDESPINAFAKDAGTWFYDHDFVEGIWAGQRGKPVRELFTQS